MSDSTVDPAAAAASTPPAPAAQSQPLFPIPEDERPAWEQYIVPWMASALVHLAIILIAIFILAAAAHKARDDEQQLVVPNSFGDPSLNPEGPDAKTAGPNVDPNKMAQDRLKDILRAEGWTQSTGVNNASDFLNSSDAGQDPFVIARGSGGTVGTGGANGASDGGNLAPYGSTQAGGGPKSSFYGTGGAATRIVYILDHSGSMIDNFEFLQKEATRSIQNLLPVQFVNVIMVSQTAEVVGGPQLERATAAAKTDLARKVKDNFRAEGQNDDLLPPFQEAFERAFAMKPEMVYFLTDGHFDPALMDVVDRLNKDKKVKVHTLAFVNHDPSYEEQLQLLAKRNGGTYKFVSEQDLGK